MAPNFKNLNLVIDETYTENITSENIIKFTIKNKFDIFHDGNENYIEEPDDSSINNIYDKYADDFTFSEIKFDTLFVFDKEIESLPKTINVLNLGKNFNSSLKNIVDCDINKLILKEHLNKK